MVSSYRIEQIVGCHVLVFRKTFFFHISVFLLYFLLCNIFLIAYVLMHCLLSVNSANSSGSKYQDQWGPM